MSELFNETGELAAAVTGESCASALIWASKDSTVKTVAN
jgi:hypothetical protein